jgi:hypothetical protein
MSISSKFYLKRLDSDLHSLQDLPFNRYYQRFIALHASYLYSVLYESAQEKKRRPMKEIVFTQLTAPLPIIR